LEFLQLSENILLFVALHVGEPHGMREYWNTGYKKREKIIYRENVVSAFCDDACRTSSCCFRPENKQLFIENQYNSFFCLEL
jgi:hypothetical protein